MSPHRLHLLDLRLVVPLLLLVVVSITLERQFMLIRIKENSMSPTLYDGQWALVLRGSQKIRPGDIAVFCSPIDNHLVVKRYIFGSDSIPVIDHGWLMTPWGRWFLTGSQWDRLEKEQNLSQNLLFMVGDNQFQSLDSRSYGYIQADQLIGRVLVRKRHD